MGYDTVKDGIIGRLNTLGYIESKEAFDFENASANEYGNTFIIVAEKGGMDEETSETLSTRFYDIQEWSIFIAFAKSSNLDIVSRDKMLRAKDSIIADLDKPSNSASYVRLQKYKSWEVQENDNYYLLTIKIKIADVITYA